MPIAITVPRLGWNMDEGIFAGWLKRDGETVREGEPLFSLEGDKATQDVESIDPGLLKIPPNAPAVGDRIAVGAVIGFLVQPGEAGPIESPSPTAEDRAGVANFPASAAVALADRPRAREGPRSTPLARRIARERGIDWTQLRGSGAGGRIRKVDVLGAAPEPVRSVPVGRARRTIAARMLRSRQTTAPVTLTTSLDATNLVNLRRQFQHPGPPERDVPSYTDFVVKLVAVALRDHPLLNARWADDRIEIFDEAQIGIAVDVEAGLLVPVIRGATGLGLLAIAERSRDLVRKARERRLAPGDMEGGTFTITNLGAFGVEAFTPIINPPECAILGMGRIARQPVMIGDQVVPRDRMTLSLTFDHRIVDGAPAARFLQGLVRLIENPGPALIG